MVIVGMSFRGLLRGLPTPPAVPLLVDPSLRTGTPFVPFIRFRVSVLPGRRGVRVGVARCIEAEFAVWLVRAAMRELTDI